MFAVVSHKGSQYKFFPGQEYEIDLLPDEEKVEKQIIFDNILLVADDNKTVVGQPGVAGARVIAEIIGDIADKKVRIFKFRAKKRYKRTLGHRQGYTRIKIIEIKLNEK